MRKFAFGAAVLLVLIALVVAGPAFAQDDNASTTTKTVSSASAPSPAPAPKKGSSSSSGDYNWGGFSLGASMGYSWGRSDTAFIPLPSAAVFINLANQSLRLPTHGVIGGLQAGWDHQHNYWVMGLAVDFSGSGMQGHTSTTPIIQNNGTPFPGAGFLSAKESTKWMSTVRGRVGIVADKKLLFYATGGAAFGRFIFGADTDFRPVGTEFYIADISRVKVGWTVGGGIQYGVSTHWNMGWEYLYYSFPNEAFNSHPNPPLPPFSINYNWGDRGNIVRFVTNYKF
jgi:outer membrane immunogenic protein